MREGRRCPGCDRGLRRRGGHDIADAVHPAARAAAPGRPGPDGRVAGGELAAAVSNAGGLGLLGAGGGDRAWLDRELPLLAGRAAGPWGVGFQSWAVGRDTVEHALQYQPAAVMLSFGDPRLLAPPVRDAGALLIIQVTDLEEARLARDLGADVIVAQGTEAGGHGARRGWSTLPFVPVVADLAAPVPVLAAGGIADGRGVAAALSLGAAGAVVGTRFLATAESLTDPAAKKAVIKAGGEQTERSSVLDIARGSRWPRSTPGGPSPTRSSSGGVTARTNWPPAPGPGATTKTGWRRGRSRGSRCGRARRWT